MVELRLDYAAWLTEEINDKLFPFEQALRSIGAGKGFVDDTIGEEEYREDRLKKIKQVYAEFRAILSIEPDGEPDENIAVENVKKKVREILDIEDLVQLRKA